MTCTIESAPVDHDGVLLHADDAVAQTCLAVRRLEAELAAQRIPATGISAVRLVLSRADAAGELVEIVAEGLDRLRVTATITVVAPAITTPSGALVGLQADVDPGSITLPARRLRRTATERN